MESRLLKLARFFDVLWWVWVVVLCWDTVLGVPHWDALMLCASRWAVRGLTNVAVRLRAEREDQALIQMQEEGHANIKKIFEQLRDDRDEEP